MILKNLLLFLSLVPVYGQSWDPVLALKPGDRVKVVDQQKKEHKGSIAEVTPDQINLIDNKRTVAFQRADVRRVEVRSNGRRARNAAIGAGIGLAIGAVIDGTLGA